MFRLFSAGKNYLQTNWNQLNERISTFLFVEAKAEVWEELK